jgi:hypothetical protein
MCQRPPRVAARKALLRSRSVSSVDINESGFPLVVVSFSRGVEDDDFARYLQSLERIYRRREKFALVLDATYGAGASARQRKLQADWLEANSMMIRTLNVATAFVVPSAVSRGVLTAILWIQPLPCPYALFETTPEALRWCGEKLSQAGIALPRTANQNA